MRKSLKKLRRKKSSDTSHNSSSLLSPRSLFIWSSVISIGYFFWQPAKATLPIASPLPTKPVDLPQPASKRMEALPELAELPSPATMQELDRLRDNYMEASELGIDIIDLKAIDGVITIPLTFIADKQWCKAGDLDTLDRLIDDKTASELLVSIEPLNSLQKGDSLRLSVQALMAGFTHDFKLTLRHETESFGLFICRDLEKKGSCRKKILKTHAAISDEIAGEASGATAKASDYLFYFQNFVITPRGLEIATRSDFSPAFKTKMKKMQETQYKVSAADFEKAWQYQTTLRSLPPTVEKKKILLKLPYNDPRCAPGQGDFDPSQGPPAE